MFETLQSTIESTNKNELHVSPDQLASGGILVLAIIGFATVGIKIRNKIYPTKWVGTEEYYEESVTYNTKIRKQLGYEIVRKTGERTGAVGKRTIKRSLILGHEHWGKWKEIKIDR